MPEKITAQNPSAPVDGFTGVELVKQSQVTSYEGFWRFPSIPPLVLFRHSPVPEAALLVHASPCLPKHGRFIAASSQYHKESAGSIRVPSAFAPFCGTFRCVFSSATSPPNLIRTGFSPSFSCPRCTYVFIFLFTRSTWFYYFHLARGVRLVVKRLGLRCVNLNHFKGKKITNGPSLSI